MSMSEITLIVVGTVVVGFLLLLLVMARGDVRPLALATRAFFRVVRDPDFASKLEELQTPAPIAPSKPSGVPVRILGLLQREGRLIDFLMEDIRSATPDQVVAAVRDIHPLCQATLKKHVVLEPVLAQQEGDSVEVPVGFDPAAIRLIGNVTGQPPFRGTVQHSGWRVKELNLPAPPKGQDDLIVMPAEVEVV